MRQQTALQKYNSNLFQRALLCFQFFGLLGHQLGLSLRFLLQALHLSLHGGELRILGILRLWRKEKRRRVKKRDERRQV